MDLTDLNNEQSEAVSYKDGPLLVLAGAGSGKTRVLTYRIAYLIQEGISPYNILAITFTNKAAKEMKERITNLIGDIALDMQISTFHSFGLRIIRENYRLLDLDSNFVIFDVDDCLTLIKRIIKEKNLDKEKITPKAIHNKISSLKNALVSPSEYEHMIFNDLDKAVLEVYKVYNNKLRENNAVDFDDLLILPIKLFNENESVLNHYQDKFKYILIDEYQDTNDAQYKLTKLLAKKYQNICVVGDSDQAIYGFRGANYKNILSFESDYPNCKTIILNKNYRSTKNILDAANSVIKNNLERHPKDLVSVKGDGELITYYRAKNDLDEVEYVTKKIQEIGKKHSLDDIVILYRTNAQSRIFEEALLKRNIPYRLIGSVNFYARKEIKDLMSYLKVINNPKDSVSILRSINTPKRGIGNKTISDLISKSDNENISLFDAITSGKAMEYKKLILELQEEKDHLSLTEFVDLVLYKSGLKEELVNENTIEAETRLENLEEFKSITKVFEERVGLVSLEDFLYEISLLSDNNDLQDTKNRVNLMTIHAVKGLEFDYVFITGFEEGLFPHANSLYDEREIEEERRLCYVAITRAKEKLFITNSRTRVLYGNNQINPVSRFFNEIDHNLIDDINKDTNDFINLIKNKFNKKEEEVVTTDDYEVGENVCHDVFGIGKILSIDKSVMQIAFKHPYGVKTLLKNHPSIHKIKD